YNGPSALEGPIWVVIDHLKHHIKLRHRKGVTAALPPLRSPYVKIVPPGDVWLPGESVTVVLEFVVPPGGPLRYTPRVLTGPGAPGAARSAPGCVSREAFDTGHWTGGRPGGRRASAATGAAVPGFFSSGLSISAAFRS